MFGLGDKRIVYATKIGFIGLGKLGMPCAEAIAKKGFDVIQNDQRVMYLGLCQSLFE